MCVPRGVPPGSRVVTTSRPSMRRWLASMRICVDFPHPSMPSNVIKAEAKSGQFSVFVCVGSSGPSAVGAARLLAARFGAVVGHLGGTVLARRAARVLYGRDRVLEDELLLRAGFEEHRELVEAAYAARKLRAVHQVYRYGVLLSAHSVKERVLYVLGSRFAVHRRPCLKPLLDFGSLRLHPMSPKYKVRGSKFTKKANLRTTNEQYRAHHEG